MALCLGCRGGPHSCLRVGSPEGGLHQGGSLRVFSIDGEHTSMGTSMYVKKLFFFFPPLFPSSFFFLKFPDLSLSSFVFLNFPDPSHQKIFPWEHGNVEIQGELPHRITPQGSSAVEDPSKYKIQVGSSLLALHRFSLPFNLGCTLVHMG